MDLDHSFTVPAPIPEVWDVLDDVPRVAACVPGATLTDVRDDEYEGTVRVGIGPMTLTYEGVARVIERDEETRHLSLTARGRERRGSGTADVTFGARLESTDEGTRVDVRTTLAITGKPAQFGRAILEDVGRRIIDQFAASLSEELVAGNGHPSGDEATDATEGAAPPATPRVNSGTDVLQLGPMVSPDTAKKAALAVVAVLLLVLGCRRRSRGTETA